MFPLATFFRAALPFPLLLAMQQTVTERVLRERDIYYYHVTGLPSQWDMFQSVAFKLQFPSYQTSGGADTPGIFKFQHKFSDLSPAQR